MPNNNNNIATGAPEPKYAGFGIRLFAYIIDNLILGIGVLFVKLFIFVVTNIIGSDIFTHQVLFQYTWSDIMIYICKSLYFVLLTYFTSATIGKHILKLKVISTNDNYTFVDILYRETIGRFLSKLILCVGYLLIFINKDKSTLHDMLADTRVIYKDTETKKEVNVDIKEETSSDNVIYDCIQIDENADKIYEQIEIDL